MERRKLGSSDLKVTAIGLGLAALGRPGYINIGHAVDLNNQYAIEVMEYHAHEVLDAAWDAGIRYFDVARSYGRAEGFLAAWLKKRGISPAAVTIGSKWGYTYTADWQIQAEHHEIKEHSLPVLEKQIQESRQILEDYLNIYQIHSATLESKVLENQALLKKLATLKTTGLRIGLSLSGPQQAATLYRALQIRFDGELLFSTVQATWNLLSQEVGNALEEASDAGLGIIVKEALANGRLTSRNQDASFTSKKNALTQLSQENNTTIDAVALAGVLAQPWVNIVLSGAAKTEHLRSNVAALNLNHLAFSDELLQFFREPASTYWAKRSELSWN